MKKLMLIGVLSIGLMSFNCIETAATIRAIVAANAPGLSEEILDNIEWDVFVDCAGIEPVVIKG